MSSFESCLQLNTPREVPCCGDGRFFLGQLPLDFENILDIPVMVVLSDFHARGSDRCFYVRGEGLVQPGESRRRTVLLHLAQREPQKACQELMKWKVRCMARFLSTPTRRSPRLGEKICCDDGILQFNMVIDKTRFLNKCMEVPYTFLIDVYTTDMQQPQFSRRCNGSVMIPRGAPKDYCIHFTVVEY